MADRKKLIRGIVGHFSLFFLNFLVFIGIVESTQLFSIDLPILNFIFLAYIWIHTFILLSIQMGLQILELIKVRMPTLLIGYYFTLSDEELIPIPLLDPTRSKLAVIIILLVISGGPIFYPIFAIYGFMLTFAYLVSIALDPSVILTYFELFLNWMPPVIGVIFLLIIMSIVAIEFKHR